MIISFLKC